MLEKKITYTDYNGVEKTGVFYFNISRVELMQKNLKSNGTLADKIQSIVDAKDTAKIGELFREIILDSYGVKSEDGERFIKNQEVRDAFEQSPAYDVLWMELATDADAASAFINAIVPVVAKPTKAIPASKA